MSDTRPALPPLMDLPPGRLAARSSALLAELAADGTAPAARWRRPGRRAFVIAALIALAVAAPALAFRSQIFGLRDLPPQAVLPAAFSYLPKPWSIDSDELDVLSPNGAQANALALSWRYRPGWPSGPVGQLSRNRILISVHLFRTHAYGQHVNLCATTPRLAGYPVRLTPLQLPRTTRQTLDATPNVPEYRVFGRYRNYYDFEVRVDIANPHPPAALWRLANRIVEGIVLPPWPLRRSCPRA